MDILIGFAAGLFAGILATFAGLCIWARLPE